MKISTTLQVGIAVALGAFAASNARGALVISEVLANEVGSNFEGEFIEIYNNGSLTIDLTNYKIGDEETKLGTGTGESIYSFPSGLSIAPGQVQIVAVSATQFFTNYGFLPTYEWKSTHASVPDLVTYTAWDPDGGVANMGNGNDQALILDPNDNIVDRVSWGGTFAGFDLIASLGTPLDGQSFERINPSSDTDSASDWKLGPSSGTAAGRSTPGVVVVPEPSTWALLGFGALALGVHYRRRSA